MNITWIAYRTAVADATRARATVAVARDALTDIKRTGKQLRAQIDAAKAQPVAALAAEAAYATATATATAAAAEAATRSDTDAE